ncbi:xanthine dehydrogenase family protein subunit M [Microvirga sp. STR05]|uniref:Xanthine dehydrogenase family protein subunit M n=1 Tax=Hymenobacter duratus TaxID=2771356 RepID=A0ABR8JKW0_9BACT|nr:xanthine dehydrogenase family protein subunit M [Hymenobacter duratus]MBD2716223.1 xanthine dehydrogenase family protein subunit M [Hymenobacter duratus]MBR7951137.1 xanthine dehydrogenase family protein subunit M [Microvirga sp. STR05]
MNPFTYSRATAVADAVRDKASHPDSEYLGGGTNLIDLMKENVARPTHLVGLNKLPLADIEALPDGGLRLGALATNADTAWHDEVKSRYPLLNQAILAGASPQLRNAATNGGNLMQRTRCYYFYDLATPCNKREPGSGCSAIGGYNRVCGILGTSESCIATHPSDMCVALAALAPTVRVSGPNGDRTIAFDDFHRLPGDQPEKDNNLEPGELITGLDLPAKGFEKNFSYLKLRDRSSYAFALISVAAGLELEGNTIKDARLALGGVAHKPWRDQEAENMLKGQPATEDTFRRVAAKVVADAKGHGSNDFKIELAKRAIVRALKQAAEGNQHAADVFLNSNP